MSTIWRKPGNGPSFHRPASIIIDCATKSQYLFAVKAYFDLFNISDAPTSESELEAEYAIATEGDVELKLRLSENGVDQTTIYWEGGASAYDSVRAKLSNYGTISDKLQDSTKPSGHEAFPNRTTVSGTLGRSMSHVINPPVP